jgi:hypothetical protein
MNKAVALAVLCLCLLPVKTQANGCPTTLGYVCATSSTPSGTTVLQTSDPPPTSMPEPGTLPLLGIGAGLLAVTMWRRARAAWK